MPGHEALAPQGRTAPHQPENIEHTGRYLTEPVTAPKKDNRRVETAPRSDVDFDSATDRLTRMLYLAVGASALIFGAFSLNAFLRQIYAPFPIAATFAWILLVGLPAVLGLLSHLVPLRVLRRVAITEGCVFPFILGWWLFMRFEPLLLGEDFP